MRRNFSMESESGPAFSSNINVGSLFSKLSLIMAVSCLSFITILSDKLFLKHMWLQKLKMFATSLVMPFSGAFKYIGHFDRLFLSAKNVSARITGLKRYISGEKYSRIHRYIII